MKKMRWIDDINYGIQGAMRHVCTQKAFTLVEFVLVIAVLGIISVAAITMSPSVTPARLDAAARQVQSDIEYAKQNAMMTTTDSGVDFVADGDYTVYENSTATPLASPLTKQNMVIKLSEKFPGISIQGNYTVEFNQFGAPTVGGGGTVVITDGTNTKTILVTANTGKVAVQ